jgi:hypothetical protein
VQKWEYRRVTVENGWATTADGKSLGDNTKLETRREDAQYRSGGFPTAVDYLASLGEQGWELTASTSTTIFEWYGLYFKRPKT